MDPLNRNKAKKNLPPEETKAIKEIIELQKNKTITVKPCDKGAGIIVLDFEEYLRACNEHLNSMQDENTPYYKKVDNKTLEIAKNKKFKQSDRKSF